MARAAIAGQPGNYQRLLVKRAQFRRASTLFRLGTDREPLITQFVSRIWRELPRGLLLRQTMKRAKSPHQIYGMNSNYGASGK